MGFAKVVNGMMYKPYIVNWSWMSPACVIQSKVDSFRTEAQANDFIRTLPRKKGFLKVNAVYCVDRGFFR